jgi:hypothetical protein
MGYTHYWRSDPAAVVAHPRFNELMQLMRIAAQFPHDYEVTLRYQNASVAGTPVKVLMVNGVGDKEHEDFVFPPREAFDFCKTACKPYDEVVTACLTLAKHVLGDVIKVYSDGDPDDWTEGVQLAQHLARDPSIGVPLEERD